MMTPAHPTKAEFAKASALLEGIEGTTCCECIHKRHDIFVRSIAQALAEARESAHEDGVRDGIAREWQKNNPSLSFEPTEARSVPVCIGPSEDEYIKWASQPAACNGEESRETFEWFRSKLRPLKLPGLGQDGWRDENRDIEWNKGFRACRDAVEKMNK